VNARFAQSLLLLLVVLAVGVSAADSSLAIAWEHACPIDWHLFQATPPPNATRLSEAAAIHMTIRWRATYVLSPSGSTWAGHVDAVDVTNTISPALSWVVPGKACPEVLRHEQGHFDLNEVYRRKLDLLLPLLTSHGRTSNAARHALDEHLHRTAAAVLARLEELQSRYDAETRHGTDAVAQAVWDEQIAAWLLRPLSAP